MQSNISFSSSKFKIHGGGMSSSDQIKKRREKHINETVDRNNEILMRNNKIVKVNNYTTYLELTRPKHTAVYEKNILKGHNLYKSVNKSGSIKEREECSGACDYDSVITTSINYLEESVSSQTNIDISFNGAKEEAIAALP